MDELLERARAQQKLLPTFPIIGELADKIERLQAAIKPFADLADGFDDMYSDTMQLSADKPIGGDGDHDFTLGDIRRAAAILKK